jgi:2-polyprenyl-3-methyl-5-hydroxy-6-metoxy-1,4-benzoquinol methylase
MGGLDPMPNAALWPQMYCDGYFEGYSVHHSESKGYAAGREVAAEVASKRLDLLKPYCSGGRLLDLGCAGGHFLATARERGFEVMGVEYNPSMAAFARENYGLQVLQGDVMKLDIPGTFDVIHAEDVVEHLEDPLAVLNKMKALLRPGGLLIIDGPLERQPNPSLALLELNFKLRNVEDPEMSPAHIWQFTLSSQRGLLKRAGFRERKGWVYEEQTPPIPRTGSLGTDARRMIADAVKRLSVWMSRRPALQFLQMGDRALVVYAHESAQ